MKNKFIKISFVMLAFLLMLSCEEQEDFTNVSSLTATSPSLTVSLGFTNEQTLVEQKADYDFTVTISEVQIVDVLVQLEQTGGTATAGADFTFPSTVTISKGSLSASGTISILADELKEDTETATLQIGTGSEVNVNGVTGETVTFNIANLTEGDLVVGMSWAASSTVTDHYGNEIDAYDLADLRLALTDSPYTTVIDSAEDTGAKTYVLSGNAPDGEYSFVADFLAAMSHISTYLDITLTFNQVGTINDQKQTFTQGISTEFNCDNNYLVMTKVTKVGTNYTLEKIAENSAAPSIAGTYDVVSNGESTDGGAENNPLVNFASTVVITDNGDGTFTFSDGWAGVYVEWYTVYGYTFLEEQTITLTTCLELSGSWNDAFGGGNSLTGTVNADGTLSIRLDNVYGDYADATYTIQ
jgi:hypothetical protein